MEAGEKSFVIFFKTLRGTTISLNMKSTDTIETLK